MKKNILKTKIEQKSFKWWYELPIQNLYDMSDSMVGYGKKYYPEKSDYYHLSTNEILNIFLSEHKELSRNVKIKKIINKWRVGKIII